MVKATGLNSDISCSRYGHELTLVQPFLVPLRAEIAEKLDITIEEFVMPTSEQDLGTLSIITYDIREDIFRPIDQLDVEGLRSRSGEITKIKEVESSSQVTGAFEQEYTFEFST